MTSHPAQHRTLLLLGVVFLFGAGCGSENGVTLQAPTPTFSTPALPTASPRSTASPVLAPGDVTPEPTGTYRGASTPQPSSTAVSGVPTPTATPGVWTPTAPPAVALVMVSAVGGYPGDRVRLSVSLRTAGFPIAGVQNDLIFDRDTPIVTQASGRPDCTANAANEKVAISSFQPPGCDPATACTGIRVVVYSPDNLDPIPDGAELYTCALAIAPDARPGNYTISTSTVIASDPHGNRLPVNGVDGAVFIYGPTETPTTPAATATPTASLPVSTATSTASAQAATPTPTGTFPTATPAGTWKVDTVVIAADTRIAKAGQRGMFTVGLVSRGFTVVGVQHDLSFDRATAIVARPDGSPDCWNELFWTKAFAVAFEPPGCDPATVCTSIRAITYPVDNLDPIPPGFLLYACNVQVAPDAAPGIYPLEISAVVVSDPEGNRLPARGGDGAIWIAQPDGTLVPTPTTTPP